jgi:hypothetical protein
VKGSFALALCLALGAAIAAPAHAQTAPAPPPAPAQSVAPALLEARQANYAWDGDLLRASFSYRDVLADPVLVKKLSSGLPMVIALRAYVYREGEGEALFLQTRVCRVVYDLWDEVYRVHLIEPERERDQAVVLDGVFRLCTEAQDLPIVRRTLLGKGSSYFLSVIAEVNPVSPEMVDQIRRWMSRPTGSTSIGPSDALFGNFVQLFARQIATSDASVRFRTGDVKP